MREYPVSEKPLLWRDLLVSGGSHQGSPYGADLGIDRGASTAFMDVAWLGLPLWVLEHPQYLILAALTGFLASGVRFPADTRWVGMLLLVLDFGASVAFGVSAGERTFALTRNPDATALGSVLTASGGGFLAALIGRYLLSRANDRGGANEL